MKNRKVRILIPQKTEFQSPVKKRVVAVYARVSTSSDEQLNSFEAQSDYYQKLVQTRHDWELYRIYQDAGISGTSVKHRQGFKDMIADAYAKKFNLIITKSLSRFARNTLDTLTYVRKLKEIGCEVYFEKENLWTLDSKSEFFITIMSGLAQDESRSTSENVRWGKQKAFADGKYYAPFSRFLGYTNKWEIVPEEANIVKKIFEYYLSGYTYYSIATLLTEQHISTPTGDKEWNHSTVNSILTNEKYKGDADADAKTNLC